MGTKDIDEVDLEVQEVREIVEEIIGKAENSN